MQFTEDRVTEGLIEQMQIATLIFIEESILKVKVMIRRGFQYVVRTFPIDTDSLIGFSLIGGIKSLIKDLVMTGVELPRNFQVFSMQAIKRALYNETSDFLKRNLDKRDTKHLISRCGLNLEFIEYSDIETLDGYILTMHRIRKCDSFNVVYFQHGVMDTSVTWVLHGPNHGLG